jgi:hypothetical protein
MSKAGEAIPTVTFIDEYCQLYQDLFPDVRSFEHFKYPRVANLSGGGCPPELRDRPQDPCESATVCDAPRAER